MADPYVVLAPLVEPPLPPVPAAVAHSTPWLLLSALLVTVLVLALWFWWWRRARPGRALRRIARMPDTAQGAHALAHWQRRFDRALAPQWQQELDRLRFAAPDPQAVHTLQRLCAEAGAAQRSGRAR
jgi:hypothetical protein